MSEFLTQRLLAVLCLSIAFCLMTVLAHRTKVHADLTRTLGLGIACALTSCSWWVNTITFSELTLSTKIFSIVLFLGIGLTYSGAVIHSRSILRWAGAFAACLLLIISFLIDALYSSYTTDITIAFAISLLSINFFGHLLRARVNQALLRGPKLINQNPVSVLSLLSLLRRHPKLTEDKDFITSVGQLNLTTQEAIELLKNQFTIDTHILNFPTNGTIALRTLLNVCLLCKQILRTICFKPDTTLSFSYMKDGIHVQILAPNHLSFTQNDLKPLYKLDADSLRVSVDRDNLNISLGYRF